MRPGDLRTDDVGCRAGCGDGLVAAGLAAPAATEREAVVWGAAPCLGSENWEYE